ncbi:hypothetical protein B0I35DRAFT_427160 [Stachybotrys elegans]|uniref:Uncharacterized protein n=1 Tax=Stachybotrys elegans TaxID=80388 RepID=A0A8K0SUH5_9HYPO|nr:hypothetical protein B0I35DRAFT_427160 [Stachybotrys elegans]
MCPTPLTCLMSLLLLSSPLRSPPWKSPTCLLPALSSLLRFLPRMCPLSRFPRPLQRKSPSQLPASQSPLLHPPLTSPFCPSLLPASPSPTPSPCPARLAHPARPSAQRPRRRSFPFPRRPSPHPTARCLPHHPSTLPIVSMAQLSWRRLLLPLPSFLCKWG